MWRDTLAEIAIWLGAIPALLKLIDVFLPPNAKKWITARFEDLWIELRLIDFRSFALLFTNAKVHLAFGILIVFAISGMEISHHYKFTRTWIDAITDTAIGAFVTVSLIHPRVTRWMCKKYSLKKYLAKGVTVLFITICIVPIHDFLDFRGPYIYSWMYGEPVGERRFPDGSVSMDFYINNMELLEGKNHFVGIYNRGMRFLLGLITTEIVLVSFAILLPALWLIVRVGLQGAFVVAAYSTFRLATHADGPLLVIGVLIAALAAYLKAFIEK